MYVDLGKAMSSRQMSVHVKCLNVKFFAYVSDYFGEFKNSLIIINFWATWCAPCIEEMPSLNKLKSNPDFKNLEIIPINVGRDSVEKSKNFYKKLKINNLEIYFDESVELANKFLLRGLPTTIFINKNGEEFARIIGFVDFDNKKIIKWLKEYD